MLFAYYNVIQLKVTDFNTILTYFQTFDSL